MTQMSLMDLMRSFSSAVSPGTPGMGICPEHRQGNRKGSP
jgi:hypothetical protein